MSVVSEIIDIEKHRKSRGHEGVISGPAYEIVLDYVDIFSMSLTLYYPWRRHVVVEYSFRWPNCGCQMHDSMHLHDDDSGDYVIDCVKRALSRFLGARIEDGELRCPKCQVCEMDLDYECEGYEESYPLDVERGYASRKEMEEKYGL